MLKPRISTLKVGQRIWAVSEEIMPGGEILANFEGDLLRVKNMSDRLLRPGQRIQLKVESLHPLRFSLCEPRRLKFGLDVEA